MKALDKIYVQEGSVLRTERTYDNDVAYVREDVLIEFAKSFLTAGAVIYPQTLIDKIESL